MTTITDSFNASTPAYRERSPTLPASHQKTFRALLTCQTGHDGHRLSPCQHCGGQHHVHHACGTRHGPQCHPHKTQLGLPHPLETPLPGPHVLIPFTIPEPLRPFLRSHPHIADQALFHASSHALTRLATATRFIGTPLPGFPGLLHPWGRPLQSPPHIHDIVPGGGLANDRTTWRPSRANVFVPVTALSPLSRAIFKGEMAKAGLLEPIDPNVWAIAWNLHSRANPNGHTSLQYLAPSVCKGAIAKSRIVSLQGRTVTCTYRKPRSSRLRTTRLDAIEVLRRFLQHVLPHGFMKVRHVGFLHANCAIPTAPLRLMIVQPPPGGFETPHVEAPAPVVASCPSCGKPRQLVMRLWHSSKAFLDTGCKGGW